VSATLLKKVLRLEELYVWLSMSLVPSKLFRIVTSDLAFSYCPGSSLLLHVFDHLPGADFTTIDVAFGIDRDALSRAGPFHFERIGDAV
jgi:hypothetical protein